MGTEVRVGDVDEDPLEGRGEEVKNEGEDGWKEEKEEGRKKGEVHPSERGRGRIPTGRRERHRTCERPSISGAVLAFGPLIEVLAVGGREEG